MLLAESQIITFLLQASLFTISLFLILVVLVQRGKGGGLTGALGGAGGQSAFGTKAGDVFTKFTVILAVIWILLCLVTIQLRSRPPSSATKQQNPPAVSGAADPEEGENTNGNNENGGTDNSETEETSPTPPADN